MLAMTRELAHNSEAIQEMEAAAAGQTYEPVTYKDAAHGFMRAGGGPAATPANSRARDDAWAAGKNSWLNINPVQNPVLSFRGVPDVVNRDDEESAS